MKTTQQLLLFCFLFSVSFSSKIYSQIAVSNNFSSVFNAIDKEHVFVQQNSTLLFTGEQLLYKVYVLNSENLPSVSKIAYVELINSDKQTVFKQKIRLKPADGSGSFRIPFSTPTGNYKLIAYTQWMRNAGSSNFYQSDLYIVNPFLSNQDNIKIIESTTKKTENNTSPIAFITLNTAVTKPRQQVEITIKSIQEDLANGSYVVSVTKKAPIVTPKQPSIFTFKDQFKTATINLKEQSDNRILIYPPEIKGELISGTVINTKTNLPAKDIRVAFSIPSKQFIFKTANTNEHGVFYIDLEHDYLGTEAIVQISDENRENYRIVLNELPTFNFNNLVFSSIQLSKSQKEWIAQKTEQIQIENAFQSVKNDSIVPMELFDPFYEIDFTYDLDAYTKFKTVQETMIEIVEHAWVSEKKGKHFFFVRDYLSSEKNEELLPLILIDGILVQDHEILYHYNINNIKAFHIITDKFSFNNKQFGGVILVDTRKIDYRPAVKDHYLKAVNLFKPQRTMVYFQPAYSDSIKQKRIPDYRSQLLWLPNFKINSNESKVSFFTSDIVGEFEVKFEGFTSKGIPVLITKSFVVD